MGTEERAAASAHQHAEGVTGQEPAGNPTAAPVETPVETPVDIPVDISVVVPAHQRAATIERTVRSVLAQEGCRFEVVVVDDGSTDGTAAAADLLAAQHPHVHVLHQVNTGVSAARNAGALAARGRYLTFLDCDDEVTPGWLATYVRALDAGATLVFAPAVARHSGGRERRWEVAPLGPAFHDIDGLFNPGMFALHRDAFLAVGGYSVAMRFGENTELGLRLTARLHADDHLVTAAHPHPLVTIHMATDDRSHADTPQARLEGALLVLDQHATALERDPRLHSSYWAISGIAAARLHRAADARRCFARALRARPNVKDAGRWVVAAVPVARRRVWAAPAPASR